MRFVAILFIFAQKRSERRSSKQIVLSLSVKTSAECIGDHVRKLEALVEKVACTEHRWQKLEKILRSKPSGVEVREKYVSLTISSAPVPRCGNRFSDRSRKSEVKSARETGVTRIRKEISRVDKRRDNVRIT